jgi:hypothetical protein
MPQQPFLLRSSDGEAVRLKGDLLLVYVTQLGISWWRGVVLVVAVKQKLETRN